MTATFIGLALMAIAMILNDRLLLDLCQQQDKLRNYTVSLECAIQDLQNRIYKLEKKGGSE